MNGSEPGPSWERLGDPPPDTLADARLQLHWAVHLLAAFGRSLVAARSDSSHSAVTWDVARRALVTAESTDGSRLRLALRPGHASLHLLAGPDPGGDVFPLRDRRWDEAFAWLQAELLVRLGKDGAALEAPSPDIPGHPVARGAAFDADPAALAELERWFHDAHLLLEGVRAREPSASPVRCWPHHFDMATLVTLDPNLDPEEARSIGVGMTPGDGSYAEPYWYVTPWPYPEDAELPDLPRPARWHTEGWLGAVLTAPDLVAAGDAAKQAETTSTCIVASIDACRALLEF